MPLDLEVTENGLAKWIKRRNIPKNRAFVDAFLSKQGLSSNRPMDIISVSKGLSLNDVYWVVEKDFKGKFKDYNLYDNKFAIIIRRKMSTGGILAYYYTHLGCVLHYLINGYIPIIDLISHPNIFNGFNTNISENPWEIFFNQPFGYTLENVKKNAKNFEYIECNSRIKRPYFEVYYNFISKIFWQNIANKYTPIKDEIIKEANKYFKKLFKNKNNILGVLIRGTDYTAKKPYNHAIQPSPEMVLEDVKKMDQENKYDWIFVTTEDDLIREKFILNIGKKLKYIKSNKNINYDYNKKELLAFNKNIPIFLVE